MQLKRTLIIPTDDIDLARDMFNDLVYEQDKLMVIVLGDDDEARLAIKYADSRARLVVAGFERSSVWIRDKQLLAKEIMALKNASELFPTDGIDSVVALSVSIADKVADVIRSGSEIDFVRVELAYAKAGE